MFAHRSEPIVLNEPGGSKRSRGPELSPEPKRPRRGRDEFPVRRVRDEDRHSDDRGRSRNDYDEDRFRNYNFRAGKSCSVLDWSWNRLEYSRPGPLSRAGYPFQL